MRDLPEYMRKDGDQLIRKYESLGWKDIHIGFPDYSDYSAPCIIVQATSPSGKQIHYVVCRQDVPLETIRMVLDLEP